MICTHSTSANTAKRQSVNYNEIPKGINSLDSRHLISNGNTTIPRTEIHSALLRSLSNDDGGENELTLFRNSRLIFHVV